MLRCILGISAIIASIAPLPAIADQPNILFILTEDQGAQVSHSAFSQFGSTGLQTPNMDDFIDQGVGFTNAFVTTPVCSASKAAIYTGLYGHTNGIRQNTTNVFGPKTLEQDQQNTDHLYNNARIHEEIPTLVQKLNEAGYYTGVTHKLHVAQNHQFPYDSWDNSDPSGSKFNTFINQAGDQPWMYFANIKNPHQPFLTDGHTVDSNNVSVPGHFPDTPTARSDWAKYLAGVEAADEIVGGLLNTFNINNLAQNTIVVFLGDHGPGVHRGKMSPHDFGLRTVMSIGGPGIQQGTTTSALASAVDLMPTLLDAAGIERPETEHGKSLLPLINNDPAPNATAVRDYVVGEVSANKTGSAGHQERSIYDGQYRLVYRHDLNADRQVNADLWKDRTKPLNNGQEQGISYTTNAYHEIASNSQTYQNQFEMLAQVHNGRFHTAPPQFELYHTASDTWETSDLADNPQHRGTWNRLYTALRVWAHQSNDTDTPLKQLWAEGETVVDDFTPFTPFNDNTTNQQITYSGKTGQLKYDPDWKTRRLGPGGADFVFDNGVVNAPAGQAVATHDALMLLSGQDFTTSVVAQLNGGSAAGLVFGYQDTDNYYTFELLNGIDSSSGLNDARLLQWNDGVPSELAAIDGLPNSSAGEFYTISVDYDASSAALGLTITDSSANPYYSGSHTLAEPLRLGSLFGMNATDSASAKFTSFRAQTFDVEQVLGDFNGDGGLTAADVDLITNAFGAVTPQTAIFNLSAPDNVIDQADVEYWQNEILPSVQIIPEPPKPNLTLIADPATGAAMILNASPFTISIDGYTIYSRSGQDSLDGAGWESLENQGEADWRESPQPPSTPVDRLSELRSVGVTQLAPGEVIPLGDAFIVGSAEDLAFEFRSPDSIETPGDFNGDMKVDAVDYSVWREGLSHGIYTASDYLDWQSNYGTTYAAGGGYVGEVVYGSLSSTALGLATGEKQAVPAPSACGSLVVVLQSVLLSRYRIRQE